MMGLWIFGKAWAQFMGRDRLGLWCSPHANKPGNCAHLHPVTYIVLSVDATGRIA